MPRQGASIAVKANISDMSPIASAYADFSAINTDNPSGYSNKQADSCTKTGSYWICEWNDITAKVAKSGDYDITISYTDQPGNSGSSKITKAITLANNAPVLSVDDITADEGDLIKITPSATDADGDAVTYSYSGWMNSDTYQTDYSDAGTYQVTVTATDDYGASNSKTITIKVNDVPTPDLEIKDISFKPDSPSANQPIMLKFTIKNIGETKAQAIKWIIEDSSATVSEQQGTFDLDVNEEMVLYPLIKYPSAGTYNPIIKVDSQNSIQELDEANNQHTVQIVVG
jgi:hypothetical protein